MSWFKPKLKPETIIRNVLGQELYRIPSWALYEQDLRHLNLTHANLERAVLYKSDLRGVSFWGARLAGANFSGANLEGCDFAYSDLTGADFRGASLEGADFYWANIARVNFSNAVVGPTTHIPGQHATGRLVLA